MSVMVFGINYKTAPIAEREHWSISQQQIPYLLQRIRRQNLLEEAVILSTCNRTEIYTTAKSARALRVWLKQQFIKNPQQQDHVYTLTDEEAIQHAMRVASGADSLILGEPEIFGQIKQAYRWACEAGMVGQHLQHFFPIVFTASKAIRCQTGISQHAVSLAYLILQEVKKHYDLKQVRLLLIGSGEVIQLVARQFSSYSLAQCLIAVRDVERAQALAQMMAGQAIPLEALPDHFSDADVVISATSSQRPILKKHFVESAVHARLGGPLLLFDLAVPRDIDPDVQSLSQVMLYNIDTLCAHKHSNRKKRTAALVHAEAIIKDFLEAYQKQKKVLAAAPLITHYRERAHQLCDASVMTALREINLGESPEVVVRQLAQQLMRRLLHAPTVYLRYLASSQEQAALEHIKKFLMEE